MYQIQYRLRYQWTFKRFKNPDKRYKRKWIDIYAKDKKQALKLGLEYLKWWCKNGNRSNDGLDWGKAENILCEPIESKGRTSGTVSDREYNRRNCKDVYPDIDLPRDRQLTYEQREAIRAENKLILAKELDGHDYVYIKARKDSALAKKRLARNSK